jgi:hypothetical protein
LDAPSGGKPEQRLTSSKVRIGPFPLDKIIDPATTRNEAQRAANVSCFASPETVRKYLLGDDQAEGGGSLLE